MEKTGIASIDEFFKYGETDSFQPLPYAPIINEVLEMFQSEYTENLYDRKANAIVKFCNQRPHGFFYQEIEGLTLIFEYARRDLFEKEVMEMVPALKRVLEVVSDDKNNMFNKNAGSDQLRYLSLVPAFLDSLEPFLRYEKHAKPRPELQSLRHSVVLYLKAFAGKQISQILGQQESDQGKDLIGLSPTEALLTQGTKHLRALSASKVIDALVQLLYNYEQQLPIIVSLLQLVSYMCNYNRLAYELCRRGILHVVFEAMLLTRDFRNPVIQIAFEIFWSCIEGVGVECLNALANQQYIWAIQSLFSSVVAQGYKLDDKCLRNEILILINYLLSLPGLVQLFLTSKPVDGGSRRSPSFLEQLFEYAITDESKFYQNKPKLGDRKTMFGTGSQDLEFKKLIWSGLLMAIQSTHEQVIGLAQSFQFIKYLLLYVDTSNNSYAVSRWSGPQLRQLQQHALSILSDVILHMKDDFESKKGIFCLTKFLSNVADVERREKCLRAFANASLFQQAYKLKISQEGLLDYLLQFLQYPESPSEIRQLCFTILANLCKGCKKNRKMFRQKNGIQILVAGLKDKKIATSDRYALLALALLNCLWNCVLGSRRSEQVFINAQGVFDLLQFVQICAYSHRKLALSCLCCLVENTKVVKQFLEWNGETTMINATQLLIRLYSQEDERFGVKYQDGVVNNRERPLVPFGKKKQAGAETFLKDFTSSGTQTYLVNRIKQIVGGCDLRITIFSILYRVGFNKNQLNAMQQQKMQVIQLYPHFKMGEIWSEIMQQLKQEGIEATQDDEHWLRTSLEEFKQQMSNCVNTQTLIKRQFNQNEQRQLQRFFQVIKYNKQIK